MLGVTMELVYFLFFPKVNAVKIGISKNFPERLKQLEGEWGNIDKEKSYYSEIKNPIKYEQLIHLFFKDFKKEMPCGDGYTEFFETEVLNIIQNIDFFPLKLSNIKDFKFKNTSKVREKERRVHTKKNIDFNFIKLKDAEVLYHNDWNKTIFSGWEMLEENILYVLFLEMKGKKKTKIEIPFDYIRNSINLTNSNRTTEFKRSLDNCIKKNRKYSLL